MITERLESPVDLETLAAIERRVLWLAVRIVDYANRERPKDDALKVGGHQASSASMVTLMTALYFADLDADDRVSVKPHASPVLHAIEYLLGRLDRSYLTRLRDFGGLQTYPSRTKDPFPVDYSTGSVGLGSAAPLFGALADRYVETHFGSSHRRALHLAARRRRARRGEHLGGARRAADAPARQRALDRRPQPAAASTGSSRGSGRAELEAQFETSGWHVIELKYGRRLREAFAQRGRRAAAPADRRDAERAVPVACSARARTSSRETLLDGARAAGARPSRAAARRATTARSRRSSAISAATTSPTSSTRSRRRARTTDAADGDLRLHDQGLRAARSPAAAEPLGAPRPASRSTRSASACGLDAGDRVGRVSSRTRRRAAAARRRAARLDRGDAPAGARRSRCPRHSSARDGPRRPRRRRRSGAILLDLSRVDGLAERLVTVSPDVSVSTNLGGLINKVGVWGPTRSPIYDAMEDSPLRWRVGPRGQHIEMGIAEMNLVLLLGQLGLTLGLPARAALPDRDALRPVRHARARRHRLLDLLGLAASCSPARRRASRSRARAARTSRSITPGIGIETPGPDVRRAVLRARPGW